MLSSLHVLLEEKLNGLGYQHTTECSKCFADITIMVFLPKNFSEFLRIDHFHNDVSSSEVLPARGDV